MPPTPVSYYMKRNRLIIKSRNFKAFIKHSLLKLLHTLHAFFQGLLIRYVIGIFDNLKFNCFFFQWATFLDSEGRVVDSKALRKRIFYGGVEHILRKEVCICTMQGIMSGLILLKLHHNLRDLSCDF